MDNKSTVAHDGIIEEITETLVRVRFIAQSACSACHAKGVCSLSETEEKFVDVPNTLHGLTKGEHVKVLLEQSQGFKAVWYGYGLPLILLLTVIFSMYGITGKDALAALVGIGTLVPYYLAVFLLRKRIAKSIEFKLRRTE
jgi:sigma-E factor negative regulatory protein RseC